MKHGAGHRLTDHGALASLLTIVAVACTSAVPAGPTPAATPPAGAPETAASSRLAPPAPAAVATGTPRKTQIKLGLAGAGPRSLTMYLAADRTFPEEGLNVEMLTFTGDAEAAQALASDSVDMTVQSLNGLLNLINAGQPVKGFYGGVNHADFDWLAGPDVKTWADLKGKQAGIGSHGGLVDVLTRHVLHKHGLEPERDVQMVVVGGGTTTLQALRAGRVALAALPPPFNQQAEDEGFIRLGAQAQEVAEEWPRLVFAAKARFLDDYPDVVRAVLRGHVKAIRAMLGDREAAVGLLMERLKFDRQSAERTYEALLPGFDERGRLPARAMPVFWELAVTAGEVTEPWPESRFLDRRFIDTFEAWAPR